MEQKYKESAQARELKSEIADQKPRDSKGHFIHTDPPKTEEKPRQNPIEKFFSDHTHYSKSQDNLVDIHVGNPLRRIANLLEDIKKQKAFSFTLKGSLGIMGVALALSIFGVFGGGKLLCDKGIQSHIGTIKTLNIQDKQSSNIPFLSPFIDLFNTYSSSGKFHFRTILVKSDNLTIHLPYSQSVDYALFQNRAVIVTGNYDSCSQTLTPSKSQSLEFYLE